MEASRRTILGGIASAIAGGKTAGSAVVAELGGVAAAGSVATLGQGLNSFQRPTHNPAIGAWHKLRRYHEGLNGYEGQHPHPAIDAIKSYSPWYRAHKRTLARVAPEEHSLAGALLHRMTQELGL